MRNRDYISPGDQRDDSLEYEITFSEPVALDTPATIFTLSVQKHLISDPEGDYYERYNEMSSNVPGWHYTTGYNMNILVYERLTDTRYMIFDKAMGIDKFYTGVFEGEAYVIAIASEKAAHSAADINAFYIYNIAEKKLTEIKDSLYLFNVQILNSAGDIALTYTDGQYQTRAVKLYSLHDNTSYDIVNADVLNMVSKYAE